MVVQKIDLIHIEDISVRLFQKTWLELFFPVFQCGFDVDGSCHTVFCGIGRDLHHPAVLHKSRDGTHRSGLGRSLLSTDQHPACRRVHQIDKDGLLHRFLAYNGRKWIIISFFPHHSSASPSASRYASRIWDSSSSVASK